MPLSNRFPFEAVLFDCDGVLVDSEPITCRVLADMLGELGWAISPEETLTLFMGKMVKDQAPLIEQRTGFALTEAWLVDFRARRNQALELELLAVPGAREATAALSRQLPERLAVASGADRIKIELQLHKAGLLASFAGQIYSGHELPRNKPHPDVYLAAAHGLGVAAERCAVVEDSVTGVQAGVAAGATVFAYCPQGEDLPQAERLRQAGAVLVFSDMAALPGLLAAWQG